MRVKGLMFLAPTIAVSATGDMDNYSYPKCPKDDK